MNSTLIKQRIPAMIFPGQETGFMSPHLTSQRMAKIPRVYKLDAEVQVPTVVTVTVQRYMAVGKDCVCSGSRMYSTHPKKTTWARELTQVIGASIR